MAYSGVYVFGDSLVDAGNALKLAEWYDDLPLTDLPEGAPTADQGYYSGRFSDGYVFTDLISNKTIGVVTRPVFPYHFEDPLFGLPIDPFASDPSGNNLNFAYGGAQIRQGDEVVPDLDGQTDAFKDAVDNHADPNALYIVTMGGNDVRNLAPSGSDPASLLDAHDALDAAADKMLHELEQLVDIGVHNLMITGVPDVGLIPKYDINGGLSLDGSEIQRSAAATEYSQYLDTLIRTGVVPALQAMGAKVTYVPLMDYTDAQGNHVTGALTAILPTIAALHGLTTAELSQNILQYQQLVFFDDVHPNAQVEALVASYMHSQLTGAPWIETLPMTGADVDFKMSATIGAAGETDSLSIYLVAGTTYTFEMLGVSSLGAGYLADSWLRLRGPGGAILAADDDSGVGLDASLTYLASASGVSALEMFAVGSLTGAYSLQAAVIGGAAMQSANIYTVNSASTLVIEGAGGVGQDVVKASVSYALAAGSEIEVLRTANDNGKTAINLTGNEFGQTLIGNNGNNVLEGKGGADILTGGGGKDVFVLGNSGADTITDYARGDVVDVSQLLSVAKGVNVSSGGYLRVTNGGLIQVDVDGGGNNWVTLGAVNGTGAVTVRYLSGGSATELSLSRVAATATSSVLGAAVAAVGLTETSAAADPVSLAHMTSDHASAGSGPMPPQLGAEGATFTTPIGGEAFESLHIAASSPAATHIYDSFREGASSAELDSTAPLSSTAPPAGTEMPVHGGTPVLAMALPDLALVQTTAMSEPSSAGEVGRLLADVLVGPDSGPIPALLGGLALSQLIQDDFAAAAVLPAEHMAFSVPHALVFADECAVAHDAAPLV